MLRNCPRVVLRKDLVIYNVHVLKVIGIGSLESDGKKTKPGNKVYTEKFRLEKEMKGRD